MRALTPLLLVDLAERERQADVVLDRVPGEQVGVLEDQAELTERGLVARVAPPQRAVLDADLAAGRLDETREDPEHRRLAAARLADQRDELLLADAEVDVGQRQRLAVTRGEQLGDATELDLRLALRQCTADVRPDHRVGLGRAGDGPVRRAGGIVLQDPCRGSARTTSNVRRFLSVHLRLPSDVPDWESAFSRRPTNHRSRLPVCTVHRVLPTTRSRIGRPELAVREASGEPGARHGSCSVGSSPLSRPS